MRDKYFQTYIIRLRGFLAGTDNQSRYIALLTSTALVLYVFLLLSLLFVLPPNLVSGSRWGASVVIGGTKEIGRDVKHEGDIIAISGPVDIKGEVAGDVISLGGPVSVLGAIDGNLIALKAPISLNEGSRVNKNVLVIGGEVAHTSGSKIGGDFLSIGWGNNPPWAMAVKLKPDGHMEWKTFGIPVFNLEGWSGFYSYVLYLAMLAIMVFLTSQILPGPVERVSEVVEIYPVKSVILGAVVLLVTWPLTIFLTITIIGIPLALVIVTLYWIAKFLGYAALVTVVGRRLTWLLGRDVSPGLMITLGVGLIGLLRYLPMLGFVVGAVAASIGTGAVILTRLGLREYIVSIDRKT